MMAAVRWEQKRVMSDVWVIKEGGGGDVYPKFKGGVNCNNECSEWEA